MKRTDRQAALVRSRNLCCKKVLFFGLFIALRRKYTPAIKVSYLGSQQYAVNSIRR